MNKLNQNEFAALTLVLNDISLNDLILAAIEGFSQSETTRSQDNANICSQALRVFLK